MAKAFNIEIKGLDKALKHFDRLSDSMKQNVLDEIEVGAREIEGDAKVRVPVDTGNLRASITVSPLQNGQEIVAQADYAAYVEFGTGQLVKVPAALESYAAQFKGRGLRLVNLPARPFLFPAYEAERPQIIKRIKELLK